MNNEARSTSAGDIAAVAFLWTLWALSVVPLVVLFIEFWEPQHCVKASDYAKLYGHMFVYPLLFGLPATVFLTRPWATHLPVDSRTATCAGTPDYVSIRHRGNRLIRDLCGSLTHATPALWSFKAAHENPDEDNASAAAIRNACTFLQERFQGNTQSAAKATEQQNRTRLKENGKVTKPLDNLNDLSREEPRSATEWACHVGYIGNTIWTALLFSIVVVLLARTDSNENPPVGHVVAAVTLATTWVPFRAAFLVEKVELYNTDPLHLLNYLVFLAFVVLQLHVLRLYMNGPNGVGPEKRNAALWTPMVYLLSALASLPEHLETLDIVADTLVKYFGHGSSPRIYITMLLLLLFTIAPDVVRRTWKGSNQR